MDDPSSLTQLPNHPHIVVPFPFSPAEGGSWTEKAVEHLSPADTMVVLNKMDLMQGIAASDIKSQLLVDPAVVRGRTLCIHTSGTCVVLLLSIFGFVCSDVGRVWLQLSPRRNPPYVGYPVRLEMGCHFLWTLSQGTWRDCQGLNLKCEQFIYSVCCSVSDVGIQWLAIPASLKPDIVNT